VIDKLDSNTKGRCYVDVGAIVIVEGQSCTIESPSQSSVADLNSATPLAGGVLAFVELLGRSLLEHTIDRLHREHVKLTSLIVHPDLAASMPLFRRRLGDVTVRVADDPWAAIAQILETYWENGCDCVLVTKPTVYMDADIADLLDFHRQGRRSVTRASDREGPLDLWVMSCNPSEEVAGSSLTAALLQPDYFPASYFVKEYVRRISHMQDLRQLVTDAFLARCHLRPLGEQLRPGVWADQGVEIRRGVRIVGPAYLGARCTIGERAVITRFSNIERDCYIDYGTVIENSSVLPNTYVGVWLDVRRSVAHGNKLLNLERGVLVEVCDPRLLRSNVATRQVKRTAVPIPRHARENSVPQASVVNRIRSINTTTEFES
jgi:NDP-sugar pyrophosphorylase family protein